MWVHINNQNQVQEEPNILNVAQGNNNMIRINPIHLNQLGRNSGNDEESLHLDNNLELKNAMNNIIK